MSTKIVFLEPNTPSWRENRPTASYGNPIASLDSPTTSHGITNLDIMLNILPFMQKLDKKVLHASVFWLQYFRRAYAWDSSML